MFHPAFRGHTPNNGMEVEQITSLVSIFSFGQQLFNNADTSNQSSSPNKKSKEDEDSDSDSDTSSDSGHSSDDHENNADDKPEEGADEGLNIPNNIRVTSGDLRCSSQVKEGDHEAATAGVAAAVWDLDPNAPFCDICRKQKWIYRSTLASIWNAYLYLCSLTVYYKAQSSSLCSISEEVFPFRFIPQGGWTGPSSLNRRKKPNLPHWRGPPLPVRCGNSSDFLYGVTPRSMNRCTGYPPPPSLSRDGGERGGAHQDFPRSGPANLWRVTTPVCVPCAAKYNYSDNKRSGGGGGGGGWE